MIGPTNSDEPPGGVLDERSLAEPGEEGQSQSVRIDGPVGMASGLPEASSELDDLTQRMRLINEFWYRVAEAKRTLEKPEDPES